MKGDVYVRVWGGDGVGGKGSGKRRTQGEGGLDVAGVVCSARVRSCSPPVLCLSAIVGLNPCSPPSLPPPSLSNGIVLAYFIAAISPNLDVANALLPTYVVTLLFFGGFLFRFHEMPPWWKWYSYIDFLRYSWGSLMVNQFTGPMGDPAWMGECGLFVFGGGRKHGG